MLKTMELEKYLKDLMKEKAPELDLSEIHFFKPTLEDDEGIYVYTENDEYYFVGIEYFYDIEEKDYSEYETTTDMNELLWNILDVVAFDYADEYSKKQRQPGRDFRRDLFAKEEELFGRFSEEFRERRHEINAGFFKSVPFKDNLN